MRVAIAAAAVAATFGSGLFLACSDTSPATPSPEDAGASDGDRREEPSDEQDADGPRAPTGCLLRTTGYTVGAKAENLPRADVQNAANWTEVEGALSDDGAFATVTLAEGQESAMLRVSGFGFQVPETAETWGIEVELKRRAVDGGVEDQQINVEIAGKPSRFKYVKGPWPTSIVGTHAYGQAVDTWGVDLYPKDVNQTSFAATLTVKRAATATGPVTAIVDSLKVAVHYCPDPIKQ